MATDLQGAVTKLLASMNAGGEKDQARLFELVYDELRRMAGGLMRWERAGHTLQPTALIHEAYVRMFPPGNELRAESRRHFFAVAAKAMQRVLVDHARKRDAEKRGGKVDNVTLDSALKWLSEEQRLDVIDLDDALKALERISRRQHEVVVLRFFAGLKNNEIAAQLDVSVSTVEKDWQAARAWLFAKLRENA